MDKTNGEKGRLCIKEVKAGSDSSLMGHCVKVISDTNTVHQTMSIAAMGPLCKLDIGTLWIKIQVHCWPCDHCQ